MTYKVLACGSRHYQDKAEVNRVLDTIRAKRGPGMLLITGGAVGADELARQWATSRKVDHLVLYAKWETQGKSAGPIRNARMLKQKPKLVVAFMVHIDGENRGTKNMISLAQDAGVKVKRFF